ncbi:MAG: response regulator transcription factor [Bacteroidales bacterium]|nr:response regulator transcription factor [Bacteroidales bacterium]
MIKVLIVDENNIVADGIESLLSDASDIEFVAKVTTIDHKKIDAIINETKTNILLYDVYNPDDEKLSNIRQLRHRMPKLAILVLSMVDRRKFILKTIQLGAKGYLSGNTSRAELIEAIYTIRSGYDYFSQYITNTILQDYLKKNTDNYESDPNELSSREIEVLRLFGEGYSNQEIADKLFISIRTVESHKTNIMRKVDGKTTVDLVKFAIKNNYIEV